jgi:hypothetical protein
LLRLGHKKLPADVSSSAKRVTIRHCTATRERKGKGAGGARRT